MAETSITVNLLLNFLNVVFLAAQAIELTLTVLGGLVFVGPG